MEIIRLFWLTQSNKIRAATFLYPLQNSICVLLWLYTIKIYEEKYLQVAASSCFAGLF